MVGYVCAIYFNIYKIISGNIYIMESVAKPEKQRSLDEIPKLPNLTTGREGIWYNKLGSNEAGIMNYLAGKMNEVIDSINANTQVNAVNKQVTDFLIDEQDKRLVSMEGSTRALQTDLLELQENFRDLSNELAI